MPPPVASFPAENLSAGRAEEARPIFHVPRVVGLWHLMSLDAPTVAAVWTMAFAWAGRVRLPWWTPLLVALVAWTAYVADRLLDAVAGLSEPERHNLRDRHFFHWRHRRALLPLAIVAASAAAEFIFVSIPSFARTRDLLLAVAALVYFSGVHAMRRPLHLRWPQAFPGKELLVGVLFTSGCALPAWNRAQGVGLSLWDLRLPAAGLAALAWLNCHAIARWEAIGNSDAGRNPADYERGSVRSIGVPGLALAVLELLVSALAAASHPRSAALLAAAALSALLLALLDRMRARLTPLALRCIADIVLLTPAPLVALAWILR